MNDRVINLRDLPVANFPDGHKHIILPEDSGLRFRVERIHASITSFDDLFLLAQAKQIFPNLKELNILYLLAARCDRRFSRGEAIDLEIVAKFINQLEFEDVYVLKPHSPASHMIENIYEWDVTTKLLDLCKWFQGIEKDYTIVSPDKGASLWIEKVCEPEHIIQCSKERETSGEHRVVRNITIPDDRPNKSNNYIIVDDLCDGGGTFLAIAKQLREQGAKQVFLVITHAIFSKGLDVFDGLIDRIYCTNSFADFEDDRVYQYKVQ